MKQKRGENPLKPLEFKRLSLAVFCGSSIGENPAYTALATDLGECLAQENIRLIYGGGGMGLMGAVARAVHKAGGDALGIVPEFLIHVEASITEIEHRIVPDMHIRKRQMYDEADAFIVLPGGIGTLEEAVEVLSWLRLSLHTKPVIFLSDTGYWDRLISFFHQTIKDGFTAQDFSKDLHLSKRPKEAVELIKKLIAQTA